jgi:type IV pilus assembly protein PilY1
VGALGAGGRGLYALDVTEPLNGVTEGDAAKRVLWEFNVDDDDAPRTGEKFGLGYVLGQPVIRRVSDAGGNQRWAAIVSGGYNNTEIVPGKAAGGDGIGYLYVIFLDGPKGSVGGRTKWREGEDYVRIPTVGSVADPNGLAPPFVADTNGDGTADYVYAGDLRGNFWKFDISGSDQKQWDNLKNRFALFTTPTGQPITAPAKGVFHPTGQGFMMMFGTGKYLELTDPSTSDPKQAFYGIWDKDDKPQNIATQSKIVLSDLLEQVINTETPENSTTTFRYITNAKGVKGPDWATQKGWYMTFTASGERSVFEPLVAARRLIFTTLIPSGSACDFGGTSFIMVVNPATGGEFDAAVLDTNGNGKLEADDKVSSHFASGFQSSVGIVTTPRMLMGGVPAGETAGKDTSLLFGDKTGRVAGPGNRRAGLFFQGANGDMAPLVLLGAGRDSGRVSWREVVKQ